jgi:hypothetical protein
MSKLKLIDEENYILEGEFEKLRVPEHTFLDEDNILDAIEDYKINYVDPGLAMGELNDGFLVVPTMVQYGGEQVQAEQVAKEEKDPAFMIIDIRWNPDRESIEGQIIILDSKDGIKVKNAINQGVECFVSASETELYTIMDKDSGRMYSRISNIQGYKISLFEFHNKL